MIRSFNDKETEKIFNLKRSKKLPDSIQQKALRKLRMLNRSTVITDLRVPPGNRLEKLKGGSIQSVEYSNQPAVENLLRME